MKLVLCHPDLTLQGEDDVEQARVFYEACKKELENFFPDVQYLSNSRHVRHFIHDYEGEGIVLAFFAPASGQSEKDIDKLLERCHTKNSVIWPVAIGKKNRRPPEVVKDYQSFDVSSQLENRNFPKDSIRTIAFIFARKLISQAVPSMIYEKCRYFLSHKRSDGEKIAGKLADEINLLARERRGYRDVVEVHVGENAQNEIDAALKDSDVLILLHTPQARESEYVKREVLYALLHDIPVLWIQIDGAPATGFEYIPLKSPHLKYDSADFDEPERLEQIANDVERQCFYLSMNHSGNIYNYIDLLKDLRNTYPIKITNDRDRYFAYYLDYKCKRTPTYMDSHIKQYIQCYGRKPKREDRCQLRERSRRIVSGDVNSVVLLYNGADNRSLDRNVYEDNYEDYLFDLERKLSGKIRKRNRSIIISGAFPDCDEIYQSSLSEALISYAKEIIQQGYTLIFGAHPTFQRILFEIGQKYSVYPADAVHMYMPEDFANGYERKELEEMATIYISPKGANLDESLTVMRRQMIQESHAEALICLGGRIKQDKSQQGVDEEIRLAREIGMPVFLSGSVGGRSSELAAELWRRQGWQEINDAGAELNENILYSMNHRKMAHKILEYVEKVNDAGKANEGLWKG